ncbi:MAG: TonB-dependent receptor plug domain-containing protein [Bacteroidetes bacterium]|nr:TonB-dependent receptor plug domain-containing protein [Bacteroidota bacterium]
MRSTLFPCFIVAVFLMAMSENGYSQKKFAAINGHVATKLGEAIPNASILIMPLEKGTISDEKGNFSIENIPLGKYKLSIQHVSYELFEENINLKNIGTYTRSFVLNDKVFLLEISEVTGKRQTEITTLPKIQGTEIYAGKKTEVINLQNSDANLAENSPRQIFAKVPGVTVWEMDGTGNQVGISTRGLNPHRTWELNVRQNGDVINSDLFGYPEAHYNPPAEALGRVEIVRGSGALQYGPQFGGMLNYIIKEPDTTKQLSFETKQTVGTFGLFSSYNALGGKTGKLSYSAYYDFRRSDGWRKNSDYNFKAWHTSLAYDFAPGIRLVASLSHMNYVNHFAAGLTDAMFEEDPRQSNRDRNYFNPTIYVPSLHFTAKLSSNTYLSVRGSGIIGERNSVQFITLPTVNDTINESTNQYNPRQVDRDYYHSYSSEAKLRQSYSLLNGKSDIAFGVRYGDSRTLRKQKGLGTTDKDFDLSLISPYKIDLVFRTHNYAAFAENVFNLTPKFSVTPGVRFEYINSEMTGRIDNLTPSANLPYTLKRSFPLFGIGSEYEFDKNISAYANFTQNFRPVLHSDLIPATDFDRTNPDLKDSRGNNSEIGIRGNLNGFLQYDLNYFRLQYDDRIGTLVESENGQTIFYKTNIGDLLNQGSEIFLEIYPLRMFKANVAGFDFSLFTSTAFNSAKYTAGTVAVAGENVNIKDNKAENIPNCTSRNGINLRYKKLTGTLQISYVGESYSDALNTKSTASGVNGLVPSYLITDFNLTYHFLERYSLKCSIGNLTDEHYFTRRATGYPGPGILPSDGRSFLVSLGARF